MSSIWTDPKLWEVGDPITEVEMNAISDNLNWLQDRPMMIKEGNAFGNKTIVLSTTVWQAIDDTNFTLTLETSHVNDDVLFTGDWCWSSNGVQGTQHYYDILVDDTYYISSGTATPNAKGKRIATNPVNSNIVMNYSLMIHYKQPTVGVHTYKLRVLGSTAATVIWYNQTGYEMSFGVLDI